MLYYKGNADLNATRIINVIGTRTPGSYGRRICEKIVGELAEKQIVVVSGLAYGIDVLAHETALKHRIPTIGVLAHGLDTIYPYAHKDIAKQMVEQGGLLTEYGSGVSPDKQNFPRRNRIVAGMADATVLIESNIKGGSMITAYIANSYNRDVFAIPGQIDDIRASGCNQLIRDHQAMIITSAQDILKAMNWDDQVSKPKPPVQKELFVELSQEEKMILAVFRDNEEQHLEQICRHSQMPGSKVASLILNLEMQHMLKSLPGQRYQLA
jgi:DNA processing protein